MEPIIFGITGSIACGKSTVTQTFIKHGIPIVDADIVAREVVVQGSVGLALLVEVFGKDILTTNQELNRPFLSSIVFSDKEKLKKLNDIIHPLIEEHSTYLINRYKRAGNTLIGYDAALIIENGNERKYNPLIVIACSSDNQLQRLMKRNSLTKEQAIKIIEAQYSSEEKIKFADYVINTDDTIDKSIQQTENIITILKKEQSK